MLLISYFDSVKEGVRFLLAVGSVVGLLGILVSICLILSKSGSKESHYSLLIFSIILVIICGLSTGIKYFRI